MTKEEYYKIIAEMETLPTGNITYKKIISMYYKNWRCTGTFCPACDKMEKTRMLSTTL